MPISYAEVDLAAARHPVVQDLQMIMGVLNTRCCMEGSGDQKVIQSWNDSRIESHLNCLQVSLLTQRLFLKSLINPPVSVIFSSFIFVSLKK